LIDTAPLALSAETEYLARSVDSVLVVIQSGVTTRAQLLAAVKTLQRLEVGAVGFVLNRVSLAKADPAFRQSLRDMEEHLRNQGVSSSMWPVKWHGILDEPQRKPEYAASENAPPVQSEHKQVVADAQAQSAAYGSPKTPAEFPSQPRPMPPNDSESPWWLLPTNSRLRPEARASANEACAAERVPTDYPESAPARLTPPQLPDWFWESGASGTGDFTRLAVEHAAAAREQLPTDAESRLERLRGLFANVGLANLHRNRESFPSDEEPPSPIPVVAPSLIVPRVAEPKPAAPLVEKAPEPAIAPQINAKPEILSPKEFVPVKEQKHRFTSASDSAWNDDDIRTLPSKRGQYGPR